MSRRVRWTWKSGSAGLKPEVGTGTSMHDSGNEAGLLAPKYIHRFCHNHVLLCARCIRIFYSSTSTPTMPEQVTPTISTTSTNDVQAVLSAAERLSGALSIRKEQATVLLSYCRELVDQTATRENAQRDLEGGELSSTSGMEYLKSYVSSLLPSSNCH